MPPLISSTAFITGCLHFFLRRLGCPVFRCEDYAGIFTNYFICFITKDDLGATVPVFNITICVIGNNYIVGGAFHGYPQAFLALTYRFFCQPALCYILHGANHPKCFTSCIADDKASTGYIQVSSICLPVPEFICPQ